MNSFITQQIGKNKTFKLNRLHIESHQMHRTTNETQGKKGCLDLRIGHSNLRIGQALKRMSFLWGFPKTHHILFILNQHSNIFESSSAVSCCYIFLLHSLCLSIVVCSKCPFLFVQFSIYKRCISQIPRMHIGNVDKFELKTSNRKIISCDHVSIQERLLSACGQ